MTFRIKLLVTFAATVVVAVTLVSLVVAATARTAFERLDEQRTSALVAQFRREFARRAGEIERKVERLAALPAMERMAVELSRCSDASAYVNEAEALASMLELDFVELVARDSSIISSAQWPARFGYKDEWVTRVGQARARAAFLKREELPDDVALALIAVRAVSVGETALYIAGGERIDRNFLPSLTLPEGMRVVLHRAFASNPPDALTPLVDEVQRTRREISRVVGEEAVQAIPLAGRDDDLLGVLLVSSSRRDLLAVQGLIVKLGLGVGSAGVAVGVLIAWWATARVTRPVNRLAAAAGQVAAGNWSARVEVASPDEIGELARTFNQMTEHLVEQRERLVQAERVAAWRELARRLAHELKNPLFPLQITVENMRRAREQYPEQFDEVFREGVATLAAELANLKAIVARFSDFARMPPPERQPVSLNDVVRGVMKLFQAQLESAHVAADVQLDESLPVIEADPEQVKRALQNLVLNALDAMPSGGALAVRTLRQNGTARLEVADTGAGLTPEERERLFTPYYTTKQHGTGLGLAIVQSVVSDHGGSIAVDSEPGKGTTFRVDLPYGPSAHT